MVVVHDIPKQKLEVLVNLYEHALQRYNQDHEAARKFTASEDGPPQLAAMTLVANAMLNLDEVLSKE